MQSKIPEILSPAGSWETLKAAVSGGADAVYFGGHSFNARRNAGNFDDSEIPLAIAYCHARGIKAYLTVNTILFQQELRDSLAFIRLICDAGVDAVIVQDLGLIRLLRQAAPSLRLHASTQMSVHNLYGVRQLADMGFSRVVLSRELTHDELYEILKESPIEIELFVHGALCMSISGQCYLSAMLGGRSGNRGLCAQPCRLPFSVPGGTGHDLSLKDLSLCGQIGELAQMGVASLKIEGRMKRPEYVAAATMACQTAAKGGACTPEQMEELQSVFSRAGFTQGYYNNAMGPDMFGARGREDVMASQSVLKKIRSTYEGVEPQRVGVRFFFAAKGGSSSLHARDMDGNEADVAGAVPEAARTKALDEELLKDKLSKTGGTPFYTAEIRSEIGPGLSLPVSEINRMRREALDQLINKRMEIKPIPITIPEFSTFQHRGVEKYSAIRIRLRSIRQLTESVLGSGAEIIFLPVTEIGNNAAVIRQLMQKGARIGAELPRAIFGTQWRSIESSTAAAAAAGVHDLLCGNLGAVRFGRKNGYPVHGDFGLNCANGYALEALRDMGVQSCVVSFEATLGNIGAAVAATALPCGMIAYGRLPLMLTRNCPLKNGEAGCSGESCGGALRDRLDVSFPVACFGGASELLNSRPLWLCDRKNEVFGTGVRFATLYFTDETPEQVDAVIHAWQNAAAPNEDFTRGLYYRGVQ